MALRGYLNKERRVESLKLMAQLAASMGNGKAAADSSTEYVRALYGQDRKTKTKHREMIDYYEKVVKTTELTVTESRNKDTGDMVLSVSGLEGLLA